MAFKDYSVVPAQNTQLSDGTYVGPNMLRNKVRPALQRIAADGRETYDELKAQISAIPAGPPGDDGEDGKDGQMLVQGGAAIANTRADLAALAGTAGGGAAFLMEEGRFGLFEWNPANLAAQVAADTQQGIYVAPAGQTGSGGAWERVIDGPINVRWFGAKRDNATNDSAAFAGAYATLKAIKPSNQNFGYSFSLPRLYIPHGEYFLGSWTWDIDLALIVEGDMPFSSGGGGTALRWSPGVTGIRVQAYNTGGAGNGAETTPERPYSGNGTLIRHLSLNSTFDGTEGEAHGVHLRSKAMLDSVFIAGFRGDGVHANSYDMVANCNGSALTNVFVQNCRNGFYLYGSDVNNVAMYNPQIFLCRRFGIYMRENIGSQIWGGDTSSNGQIAGFPTMTVYNSKLYQALPGQGPWCKANPPTGTTADNQGWHNIYPGDVHVASAARPLWIANTYNFRDGGSIKSEGSSQYGVIAGHYREGDQGDSFLSGAFLVLGGTFSAVAHDGLPWGGMLTSEGGALLMPRNLNVKNQINLDGSNAYFGPAASTSGSFVGHARGFGAASWQFLTGANSNVFGGSIGGAGTELSLNTGTGGGRVFHDYSEIYRWNTNGIDLRPGKTINFASIVNAADDAAAATAGVPVGSVYRNGSALMVRTS